MAFPPGPFTSMGLWVDRAESFKAMGLKLGVYSTLSEQVEGVKGQWVKEEGFRCGVKGFKREVLTDGDRREEHEGNEKARSRCSHAIGRKGGLLYRCSG